MKFNFETDRLRLRHFQFLLRNDVETVAGTGSGEMHISVPA